MSSGRIARSTGILAMTTGLSRVLGFVRDILLARLFGTTAQAQAFVVAFRLPNLMRDLVAEGAVTSAFVPVLSWYRTRESPDRFWSLSHALFTQLGVLLCGLGLVGALGAPLIVRLVAPGFAADPEKFELTVRLTRLLFPFITLVGFWAYFMGLLNTLKHFAMPSLAPAILNLAMIAACLWFVPLTNPGILAVAVAVLIGGVIQIIIQLPVAIRLGFRFRWRWHHPGSREILRLLGPRLVGAAVYQANVLIDTILASMSAIVGEGAVAAIYFANRLIQLPLALFGTAAAQASLPSMSEQAAAGDLVGMSATVQKVMRMVALAVLPSAVGLIVLAMPIVQGLFERGAFDHHATLMTSQALICYALGLLAYSMNKVLTGAFYALRDTRTPVRLACESFLINLLLCVILMGPLRIAGLALAASISGTINACRLARRMERRLGLALLQPVAASLWRMGVASLLMGLGCWLFWQAGRFDAHPWLGLPLVIGLGLLLYTGACRLFGVSELSTVLAWLRKLPLVQRFVSE